MAISYALKCAVAVAWVGIRAVGCRQPPAAAGGRLRGLGMPQVGWGAGMQHRRPGGKRARSHLRQTQAGLLEITVVSDGPLGFRVSVWLGVFRIPTRMGLYPEQHRACLGRWDGTPKGELRAGGEGGHTWAHETRLLIKVY